MRGRADRSPIWWRRPGAGSASGVILVDTSIWIDHLARNHPLLTQLLENSRVLIHPFIIGEIALGSLKERATRLRDLHELPQIVLLPDDVVLHAIDERRLFSTGIGYVDAHLLVSTLVSPDVTIWTRDKDHLKLAQRLGIAAKLTN